MQKYSIGLDIGTTSVGWAVIDNENYKVIRKGNKKLWGARLFEEASSASSRRLARGTRRRYDRRRKRIKLLQSEFKEEINKVDSLFFEKMKQSFFGEDDIENRTIKLTKNEKEEVKIFHNNYPTIYHLRDKLVKSDEKEDIRLIYLAIHHIIKYRGNFLYDNGNFNIKTINIKEKLQSILSNIQQTCDDIIVNDSINYEKIDEIFMNESMNDIKKMLTNEFDTFMNKKCAQEFVKLLMGYQFSIAKLLNIELEEDIKCNFKGSSYEDNYELIEKSVNEKIEIVEELKELYDMLFLKKLFKGKKYSYLSELMVYKYNKHCKDLKVLKNIFKGSTEQYKILFKNIEKEKKKCLYEKYLDGSCETEEFAKIVNKLIDSIAKDDTNVDYVRSELLKGEFLPRITNVDNGKYPYQLNLEELKEIIKKQGKYYPFLLNTCKDQEYKIVKILSFRIPYYVGPLNDTTSKKNIKNSNAWAVKKDGNVSITPYNFEDVIDKEQTAELFISRMLSNCTYLINEKALANNSILYCKFKILNELKQIKINGQHLDCSLQKEIFQNLFLKTNKVITETILINYLRSNNSFPMFDRLEISGYSDNGKFANNMAPYVDFFGEDGFFKNTSYEIDDAEKIIRWITLFEDKSILETKLKREYQNLNEKTIKSLLSKKYRGWGNLSEKLLTNKYYLDKATQEYKSIIDLLETTSYNFMQIINKEEYNFQKMIDELNDYTEETKLNYDVVKGLATSPAVKRGIYQSLRVIEEIVKYMNAMPENISIEMARGDEIKKRTENKKEFLSKIYASCKKDIDDYDRLCKQLNSIEKIDSQKMFLYFVQEGKSLYSGQTLDINHLEEYEIDHIIPQSLIKDDSIDNKALVLRIENQEKKANFVLPQNYRTQERIIWWERLKNHGLISTKKLNNLRRDRYNSDDIEGFINRQLVETRQITKHVANIINHFYKDVNVIYLHANLSHNYRQKFKLYKYRDLNDFHHAHDAYLAAVIGEYQKKKLKKVDFNVLREINKELISNSQYSDLRYGYVINSMDSRCFKLIDDKTGEVDTFNIDYFNKTINDTLYYNDPIISKKTEIKTGEFYNQTKNKKGLSGVKLKDHLPIEKYGSYTSLNPSYAIVVRYTKKQKQIQKLIGIPIYIVEKSKSNPNMLSEYIRGLLKLELTDDVTIIKDKIPFNSLLDWNGQICSLVGATDTVEVCNAKQFIIDKKNVIKWKDTLNRLFNGVKSDDVIYNNQLVELQVYIIDKIEKEYQLYSNLIEELNLYFTNFEKLELNVKEKVIKELFKLLKFNSKCANLKELDDKASSNFGKKHGRTISNAIIINKSVTGIWENKSVF